MSRAKECCVKSHTHLLSGTVPPPSTSSLTVKPLAEARDSVFDSARGLDPGKPWSDKSLDSSFSSPARVLTTSSPDPPAAINMANLPAAAVLPQDWDALTSTQQNSLIYAMLVENKTSVNNLANKVDEIITMLNDHGSRIDALEQASHRWDQEVGQLKEQRHRAWFYGYWYTGIMWFAINWFSQEATHYPWTTVASKDILEVREIIPRGNPDTASQMTQNLRSTDKCTVQQAVKTFLIKFKSHDISMHVLQAKHQYGKLLVSDFIKSGPEVEVTVFEMLPPSIFKLRAYKHVWVSNVTVFARKSDNSENLEIVTKSDWDKKILHVRCADGKMLLPSRWHVKLNDYRFTIRL